MTIVVDEINGERHNWFTRWMLLLNGSIVATTRTSLSVFMRPGMLKVKREDYQGRVWIQDDDFPAHKPGLRITTDAREVIENKPLQ
jgi:hypothetical protein